MPEPPVPAHAGPVHAPALPAPAGLAHHFDSLEQQHDAAGLGMWAFLVTEILFFGGLFVSYAVHSGADPGSFQRGALTLDPILGGINTAVLLCSSFTMVLAVHAASVGRSRAIAGWLWATILLGLVFFVIKGLEYHHKWVEGHVPGPRFHFEGGDGTGREQMFFLFYFCMTGMHAFHMVIGVGLLAWISAKALRGRFTPEHHSHVEIVGLYWHFVDLVWIFLYPLLYLIGRHA